MYKRLLDRQEGERSALNEVRETPRTIAAFGGL
jgi:hypothetical protein